MTLSFEVVCYTTKVTGALDKNQSPYSSYKFSHDLALWYGPDLISYHSPPSPPGILAYLLCFDYTKQVPAIESLHLLFSLPGDSALQLFSYSISHLLQVSLFSLPCYDIQAPRWCQ